MDTQSFASLLEDTGDRCVCVCVRIVISVHLCIVYWVIVYSNKGHCPFSNPMGKSSGTRLQLLIGLGIGWRVGNWKKHCKIHVYSMAGMGVVSIMTKLIHWFKSSFIDTQKIHGYKNIYCYFWLIKTSSNIVRLESSAKKITADPSACSGQSLRSGWSFPLESDPTLAICCDRFLWVQDHPGDPDSTSLAADVCSSGLSQTLQPGILWMGWSQNSGDSMIFL